MERLKKYLPFLMFSCKKTAELIDKNEILPLKFSERLILKYHNTICRTCHHYKKQSKIIDNTFEKFAMQQLNKKIISTKTKTNILKMLEELEN